MKLLFICSHNKDRSKTAEDIYKDVEGVQVKSAGVELGADNIVTKELVNWADAIVVMDEKHDRQKFKLLQRFPYLEPMKKRIEVYDIPDKYIRGEPELVYLIKQKTKDHFGI